MFKLQPGEIPSVYGSFESHAKAHQEGCVTIWKNESDGVTMAEWKGEGKKRFRPNDHSTNGKHEFPFLTDSYICRI